MTKTQLKESHENWLAQIERQHLAELDKIAGGIDEDRDIYSELVKARNKVDYDEYDNQTQDND